MYTLYSMQRSGNCYKVRLALAQLEIPYHSVEIDLLKGESRTPEFLAKNPNGRVPLLEVTPGRYLPESNAILWYIAGGTPLAPENRIDRAEALQWMFFEQHSLEPYIGAAHRGNARGVQAGRQLLARPQALRRRAARHPVQLGHLGRRPPDGDAAPPRVGAVQAPDRRHASERGVNGS